VTNASTKQISRKVGIVVGFVALAALPALGVGAFAAADAATTATNGEEGARPARPALTDAQKQCLADQGVTLPQRPADGTGQRPAPPTDEQRAAFRAAAEACGLPTPPAGDHRPGFGGPGGPGGPRPALTDAQKQCLADQGVTLPQRPADGSTGERPAPPTAEQREAFQKAAAACGITIPEHGPRLAGSARGTAV
jgi:hypothetical protein